MNLPFYLLASVHHNRFLRGGRGSCFARNDWPPEIFLNYSFGPPFKKVGQPRCRSLTLSLLDRPNHPLCYFRQFYSGRASRRQRVNWAYLSIFLSKTFHSQTGQNRPLCHFTLSNARRFLLIKGEPLGGKGLNNDAEPQTNIKTDTFQLPTRKTQSL